MSKVAQAPTMAAMTSWRIGVTLFGAFFQVIVGFFVPVGSLVNRNVSVLIPAGWTFTIRGPIFFLCFVFAGYQLLPSKRNDSVLRSVGWPLGITFVGNGFMDPNTASQATNTLSGDDPAHPDLRPHGACKVGQVR